MRNSYYYIPKEKLRETDEEIREDFMGCADISSLTQVTPLIEEFTKPGDIILEPFCGLGTTVIAAGKTGRRSIGIEIESDRFELLKRHVERYRDELLEYPELICGDSVSIDFPENVDAVITNVPYFDPFGNNTAGPDSFYGMHRYSEYLSLMEKVIEKCAKALKNNGYIVLFCENIRNINGDMIPQAFDICMIMRKYFDLKDERIVCYEKESSGEGHHFTNRAHEYVLTGKKKESADDDRIRRMLDITRDLAADFELRLTGSLGTYINGFNINDAPPHDIDIIIKNDTDVIRNAVFTLKSKGFEVFSWQDRVDDAFDLSLFQGRHYFRAVKGDIIIDCSYDINEDISFEKMEKYAVSRSGIMTYDINGFIYLQEHSDREDAAGKLFLLRRLAGKCGE